MPAPQRSRTPFPENEAPTERAPRNEDGSIAQVTHRMVSLATERPGRPLSGLHNKVSAAARVADPNKIGSGVRPKVGSGVRPRTASQRPPTPKKSSPALDRMAAFAALYEKIEEVIDLDQVPHARANILELGGLDLPSRRLLAFVNGKATVREIIARAGMERAAVIATFCKLATRRALTFA